jgi:hypothetical protein
MWGFGVTCSASRVPKNRSRGILLVPGFGSDMFGFCVQKLFPPKTGSCLPGT